MKALTIRQPWASLIACGVKTIETRSWKAPASLIGSWFAIHAAKWQPVPGEEYGTGWWWHWDVDEGIIVEQNPTSNRWSEYPAPLGCVVATATLEACLPITDLDVVDGLAVVRPGLDVGWYDGPWLTLRRDGETLADDTDISEQLPYGDFAPGRWAWMLTDIEPLAEPVPAKGKQGLWNWEPA